MTTTANRVTFSFDDVILMPMARTLEQWLDDYSNDHQNHRNQLIHKICVPLIFLTLMGGFTLLPYRVGPLPVGTLVVIALMAWYSRLGSKASIVMAAQILAAVFITIGLVHFTDVRVTAYIYVAVFVVAWIGQFVGHKLEGRKPSFFTDLQYLLVGPLWVWLGH